MIAKKMKVHPDEKFRVLLIGEIKIVSARKNGAYSDDFGLKNPVFSKTKLAPKV